MRQKWQKDVLFGTILIKLTNEIDQLIAGFNALSKEEQNKYDILSLCKFMDKVMFSIAFSISLFVLSDLLTMKIIYNIGLALSLVIVIFTVIYANTGDRFKKR